MVFYSIKYLKKKILTTILDIRYSSTLLPENKEINALSLTIGVSAHGLCGAATVQGTDLFRKKQASGELGRWRITVD